MANSVNKVIKLLVISDFALYFSLGLFSPLFAVFVLERVDGSTLQVVGVATAMYWIARVLTAVPISKFMDRIKGERDEFFIMIFGVLLLSLIPLMYIGATVAWQIYLIQLILGSAGSMAVPAWRILFTNHLDQGATGYEWGIEDVSLGISIALSAYIGAFIADYYGFNTLIVIVALIGVIGALVLIPLYKTTGGIKHRFRNVSLQTIKLHRKKHVRIGVRGI
jgi:MFS family permease